MLLGQLVDRKWGKQLEEKEMVEGPILEVQMMDGKNDIRTKYGG